MKPLRTITDFLNAYDEQHLLPEEQHIQFNAYKINNKVLKTQLRMA